MTSSTSAHDENTMPTPSLRVFVSYLTTVGWALVDEDSRTTLWKPATDVSELAVRVVLPSRENVGDYAERIGEALRAVAFVEQRLAHEVAADMSFGGADTVAVRLTPDSPPGEAPLELAHVAVTAMRSFVIASASALDIRSLVLPPRRPHRAESFVHRVRLSTQPGSFVLSLALPLIEDDDRESALTQEEGVLFSDIDFPRTYPFGRQVTNRMLTAARSAQQLADQVNSGDEPLRAFGSERPDAPNATELSALAELGGQDHALYQLRFARSPLAAGARELTRISVTPGQQRVFAEAAEFLRTKQPRRGVAVVGLVVRLFRDSPSGPGQVVIQGIDDDTGATRRFRVELDESDYREAHRAHGAGLQVEAEGDIDVRGTRLALRRLTSFRVIPGLEDD